MNAREELLERRVQLVLRSGQLRDALTNRAEAAAPWFSRAERLRQAGRWLVDHPWVPASVGLLLLWRRTRWTLRWGRRAFQWWRLLRQWMPAR